MDLFHANSSIPAVAMRSRKTHSRGPAGIDRQHFPVNFPAVPATELPDTVTPAPNGAPAPVGPALADTVG